MELLIGILSILSLGLMAGVAVVFSSASKTDRARIYDLVKDEYDTRVTRTSGTIKNPSATTAAAGAITVGYPVKLVGSQWTLLLSTDEANCGGLWLGDPATVPFVESLAQNAVSALPGQILFAGPAVIDKTKIPTTDVAGAAFTLATLVTALNAKGIYTLAEGTITQQQTS